MAGEASGDARASGLRCLRRTWVAVRPYRSTLVWCGLVGLLTGQSGGGFQLYLFVPIYVVWALFKLAVGLDSPDLCRPVAIRIAIWAILFASIYGLHVYYRQASRADAEAAVQAVLQYQTKQGTYPSKLEETGIDAEKLRKRWRLQYWMDNGRPMLMYSDTFAPFSAHRYDFATQQWHYLAG